MNSVSVQAITVDFAAIAGGTATSGSDYNLTSGTLTFPIGSVSQNIQLNVVDDAINELDETVIVALSNPTNAALGANPIHTYTITDNDPVFVQFAQPSSSGLESVPTPIPVTLNVPSSQVVTVHYDVTGGTATSGVDFTQGNGILTFAPGVTSVNLPLTIVNDAINENSPDDTIIITLSNATVATIATNSIHTYTILDDDRPTVLFDKPNAAGMRGTTLSVTASLSAAAGATVTVPITLGGNSSAVAGTDLVVAEPGDDFTLSTATLVFAPGQTVKTVVLSLLNNPDPKTGKNPVNDLGAILQLGSPVGGNATISQSSGVYIATIVGQEPLGLLVNGAATTTVTVATGESVGIHIHDGLPPYTVTANGASFTLGSPDPSFADVDGDQDLDPNQFVVAAAKAAGTSTVTVTDAANASLVVALIASDLPAVTLPPPVLPLSGRSPIYTPLCPSTPQGIVSLTTGLAGKSSQEAKGFAWDTSAKQFVQLPAEPTGGLGIGSGVFVATRVDLGLDFSGTPVPAPYVAALVPGWNFVGIPPIDSTPSPLLVHLWSDLELRDTLGNLISDTYTRSSLIGDGAYLWNGSAYNLVTTLDTGKGYWIKNNSSNGTTLLLARIVFAGDVAPRAVDSRHFPYKDIGEPPAPPGSGDGIHGANHGGGEAGGEGGSAGAGGGHCGGGGLLPGLGLTMLILLRRFRARA